jgi:RNA polymerase sigma-70 factor (ECF subfamily)
MASAVIHSDQLLTATSLVSSIRAADPEGWERFVKLYGGLVYSWCRRAGLGPEDASDVMQDVFRSVHRGIGTFVRQTESGTFRGWLKTITENKIRDLFRANVPQPRATGGSDAQEFFLQVPMQPLSGSVDLTFQSRFLEEALSAVSIEFEFKTWKAFWMTTMEDRPAADVSAALTMTLGAVHTAKWRVLKRLREYLQGTIK